MATADTHPAHNVHRGTTTLAWIALTLLIIGGLNWALVGLFDFDLVAALFGDMSTLSRIIYVLVGISALYCAFAIPAMRKYAPH